MGWLSGYLRKRALSRALIPADEFEQAIATLPILSGLDAGEHKRLREQASLLLHDKQFSAAGGAKVERDIALAIALQACLLTLNIESWPYREWREIVLYPEEFLHPQEKIDAAGVVHTSRDILSGESWHGGPLVLSIADVFASGQRDGVNVVLHEFAHKLDMQNGTANGFPPLHRGMDVRAWAQVFRDAYADLCARVDLGEDTAIDPYAATNPAEFFAVLTEVFFETPDRLHDAYPAVYEQMRQFYRQDPRARMMRA